MDSVTESVRSSPHLLFITRALKRMATPTRANFTHPLSRIPAALSSCLRACFRDIRPVRLLAPIVFAVSTAFAQTDGAPVTVGILSDNYPYSYRADSGEMTGFAYELLEAIEQVTSLRFERVIGPTVKINSAFEGGEFRLAQSFAQSEEREQWADFSVPYLTMAQRVFVASDNREIREFEDLAGKRVAVHAGSLGEQILLRRIPEAIIVHAVSVPDALRAVDRHEADATLAANLTGQATVFRESLSIKPVGQALEESPVRYCFAVHEGDQVLLQRLNEGLAILEKTGRHEEIYQRWFGRYDETRYSKGDVLLAVAIGLGLALGVTLLAWLRGRFLQKQLRRLNEALTDEVEQRRRAQEKAELLSAEMADVARQAREADLAKSEFLAKMSHELRTPMNAIIGMTKLLLDSPLSAEQKEFTEITRDSAEGLLSILNDILDLSRIEAGRLVWAEVEFDLRDVAEGTVDILSLRAAEKELEMGVLIEPGMPRRWNGDPGRLRQILLNLLGNAVKFTHSGEVLLTIRRAEVENESGSSSVLHFEVIDTGCGIPKEIQSALFQPFVQADNTASRRYGGVGLGLAICRQLIEQAGGKIALESEPGEGSRFWFTLPLHPIMASEETAERWRGPGILAFCRRSFTARLLQHHANAFGMPLELVSERSIFQREIEKPSSRILVGELTPSDWDQLRIPPSISLISIEFTSHSARKPETGSSAHNAIVLRKPVHAGSFFKACVRSRFSFAGFSGRSFPPFRMDSMTRSATADSAESPRPDFGSLRILVVEDNPMNRRVVDLMLRKLGTRPVFAEDGEKALEILEGRSFDLIFMDCQMPRLDGYETTRLLRQKDGERHFIVAMTANTMRGDREKCLAAGMDEFLAKPTRELDLSRMLHQALERRQQER